MKIAVDFDGTIVTHEYPRIGQELPFATETLRMLIKENHRLILWTVREGKLLDEAIDWCRQRGVEFWAINKDYPEENGTINNNHFSRKLKADLFIDDRNLGGLPEWYMKARPGRICFERPAPWDCPKLRRRSTGGKDDRLLTFYFKYRVCRHNHA